MVGLFNRKPRESRTVTISQTGRSFESAGRDSVLNDALAAGIPFPHSCTVGTCGTCKVRLVTGKVREITDAAVILSSEELRDGFILACQSVAKTSLELDVAGLQDMPDHPLLHVPGEITAQQLLTHDIVQLDVRLDAPLAYTAGQYAELTVDPATGSRAYSFAKAPHLRAEDEVTFFVRKVPDGQFTEWLFGGERVGTRLQVAGPFGNLWLRPGSTPVLCVAGGSGLAPIKALLEDAAAAGVDREFVFVFGARTAKDLYCLAEMKGLAPAFGNRFSFHPVLSAEDPGSKVPHPRGLVTDVISGLSQELLHGCTVYACGPPPMVDAVEQLVSGLRGSEGSYFFADRFLDKAYRADRSGRRDVIAR